MKGKTKLRILQILCIISIIITVFSIQRTYAKYFEKVDTTYETNIKRWVINVNSHNIHENSELSEVMQPILVENEYMNSNETLVPGREGYFEMLIDYSKVDLAFEYEFTIEQLNSTPLEDFEIYGYEVIDGETSTVTETPIIKGVIDPTTEVDSNGEKKREIRVLFRWNDENMDTTDSVGESGMNNFEDTQFRGETNTAEDTDGLHTVLNYRAIMKFNQHVATSAKPYLPTGFSQVAGTSLATGLTIQDSTGNQYVWVEVPQTTEVYPTAGLDITTFTDDEYTKIENDLHTYTSVYRNGTSYTDTYYSDAQTGLTSTQYTELKQKMLKSVYQNGGFYVGKYETGIEAGPKTSGSSSTPPTETAVIKQNAYPYNFVTCSQAQTLASGMYSGEYTSSLMFGVQWDLVLKYLETKAVEQGTDQATIQSALNSDSTSWGNYKNNLWNITNASSKYYTSIIWTSVAYGEKTANKSVLLSTGASDTFSKQGIYDLAGNVGEWTLEYTSNTSLPCVFRGGEYINGGNNSPASEHNGTVTTGYDYGFGFRVALY